MNPVALSRFLGWFSLALGAMEVLLPETLSDGLDLPGSPWLVRLFGLREVGAGLTVLAAPDKAYGPGLRVGGDVLDIGVLAVALSRGRRPGAAGVALAMVLGVTALDVLATAGLAKDARRSLATARRTRVRAIGA